MPQVPKMLPAVIHDPDVRRRAVDILTSADFQNNMEEYFIKNIKEEIQAPLN